MKPYLTFVLPAVALFLLLAGCGGKTGRTDGKVEITFWHSFVASTVPSFNELVRKFEEENPGIVIKAQYVPTGDALIQKLVTSVQSHTAPDISWIHSDFIDKLVESNAIYRMDEFLSGPDSLSRAELDDIFPPLLQGATWKGSLYAMPMEATSLALLYNPVAPVFSFSGEWQRVIAVASAATRRASASRLCSGAGGEARAVLPCH